MSFNGKNVVITGGSGGIGYDVIEQLLRRGADNIAVFDLININNGVEKLSAKYAKQKIYFIKTDVTDKENVKQSFQQAIDKFQFVDVVIGNAGILNESEPEKTINVNLLGVMHTTYAAIEVMSTASGGRGGIVTNIASVMGVDYLFSIPAYVASKHGVIGFTRCFAEDFYYKKHGIKFIMICPGFTDTTLLGDLKDKLLSNDTFDETITYKNKMALQTSAILAERIVDAIAEDKNGSIWIIEDGVSSEVTLTKYWYKP